MVSVLLALANVALNCDGQTSEVKRLLEQAICSSHAKQNLLHK